MKYTVIFHHAAGTSIEYVDLEAGVSVATKAERLALVESIAREQARADSRQHAGYVPQLIAVFAGSHEPLAVGR